MKPTFSVASVFSLIPIDWFDEWEATGQKDLHGLKMFWNGCTLDTNSNTKDYD